MAKVKRDLSDKIINIILDIFLVIFGIILIISIYNNIQIHILGNKYSNFFGYSTFEVQTGSMKDAINIGDWILVKQTDSIKLNDIVTYEKDGEFITHRVIETYKDTYITKGDANNAKDDAINKNQIIGKVIKILPGYGLMRKTLLNPIVLIALIITLYLFSYVLRTTNSIQTTDDKNSLRYSVDAVITKTLKKIIKCAKKSNNKKKAKKIETKPQETKEVSEEEVIAERLKNVNFEKEETIINKDEEEVIDFDEEPFTNSNSELENEETDDFEADFEDSYEEEIEETTEKLEEVVEEIEEETVLTEEDMDKTFYFRMVSVDKNELDDTYKQIKENEILTEQEEAPVKEEKTVDETEEKKELIRSKKKKFKNVIDKIMYLKKEELLEILDILNSHEPSKTNEPSIKEQMLTAYIDAKYYNFCGNINTEYNKKNMLSRIEDALKSKANEIIGHYKGSDAKFASKVNKYMTYLCLVNNVEYIYANTTKIQEKRDSYKTKIEKILKKKDFSELEMKNLINDILKVQKLYNTIINEVLTEQDSNTFKLEYKSITSMKDYYTADLKHNIEFSKVYSNYIVDKTYSEGVIAEEKIVITMNLLLVRLLRDMFSSSFNNKYLIYIPGSLYSKTNKMNNAIGMLNDEYAKNNIIILVKYEDLISNKKVLKDLKKKGCHFAVRFDETDIIKDKDQAIISIVDYVFLDKKSSNEKEILSSIPEQLKKNVIRENIMKRFDSNGGK